MFSINFGDPAIQSIGLIITGLALVIFGSAQRKTQKKFSNGIEAEGIVFEMTNNAVFTPADDFNDNTSYPVIRFVTKDLQWVTEEYDIVSPFLYKQGQKVKVLYNPDNPKEFTVKDAFGMPNKGIKFIISGIGLLIIGGKLAFDYLLQGN